MNLEINLLSDKQKAIMAYFVGKVANADGNINQNEGKYFLLIHNLLKNDYKLTEDPYDLIKAEFTNDHHVFNLLSILLTTALVDNNIHASELAIIKRIADILEISDEKLTQITLWSQREAIQLNEYFNFKL
ncbi:hypothetical protein CKF54_03090 [Psittacicella hinzii]|uniref:Co-chaperone DjlA N-terminal domain-containing protein n=1 Tax=Psittacicella hinzii TaxID=2028575 RepID=A0A3A1Y7D7_9GAMM|nr:TerB family tellurite resistance protein [Psittacicella hinzii]RIY33190.1 hypothetical protein CKF54_03090 [Psittacicella hinzii]